MRKNCKVIHSHRQFVVDTELCSKYFLARMGRPGNSLAWRNGLEPPLTIVN